MKACSQCRNFKGVLDEGWKHVYRLSFFKFFIYLVTLSFVCLFTYFIEYTVEEGTWVKRKGHGVCFNLKTRTNHTRQLTHIGGLLGKKENGGVANRRERRKILAASLKKWQEREGGTGGACFSRVLSTFSQRHAHNDLAAIGPWAGQVSAWMLTTYACRGCS